MLQVQEETFLPDCLSKQNEQLTELDIGKWLFKGIVRRKQIWVKSGINQ